MAEWWLPRARRRAARRPSALVSIRLLRLETRCLPATTLTAGTNLDISHLLGNENEVAIAINPTNPNNIVATTVADASPSGQWVFRSFDGGATWNGIPLVAPTVNAAISDGQLVFDNFGNLFLTLLDADGAKLLLSSNGGQTFTSLGAIVGGNVDQPSIAVGPGLTPGSGSIWMSVRDDNGNGSIDVAGASVSGLGIVGSFTSPVSLIGSDIGNFGSIAVGPSGQVLVTYQENNGGLGPASIFTNIDPDGFGPQGFSAARVLVVGQVGGFDPIPPQPNRPIDADRKSTRL